MIFDVEVLLSDGAVEHLEIIAASKWAAQDQALEEALERQQQPVSSKAQQSQE